MKHFFINPENIICQDDKTYALITGNDVNHVKNVLRMKIGDELLISDGLGNDYSCVINKISDNEILCLVVDSEISGTELSSKIYLFQGLPKADKFEHIIQKSVELGVYEIIPVALSRSVVKYDEKKSKAKIERWQKIAESAAKQSRRGIIPNVSDVVSLNDALSMAKDIDVKLIPYENFKDMKETKEILNSIEPGNSIAIIVGPEGGLAEEEVKKANEAGFKNISLGSRILRTETAPLMLLSVLMFNLE